MESSDDSDDLEFAKGKEKTIEEAIEVVDTSENAGNAIDTNDESEWQEYNPVEFGPDVLLAGNAASASSHSTDTPAVTESANTQSISAFDDSEIVMSNLVSLSAQRSFSNLNINPNDNPYCADADFGFDF